MFDFVEPRPAARHEPVLPMVNLVFLLLIFFLIAAVIAPRPPVEAPRASSDERLEPSSLRAGLTADGELAFGAARGAAALEALIAAVVEAPGGPVGLHADRRTPAADTVAVLRDFANAGVEPVWLVVEPAP